ARDERVAVVRAHELHAVPIVDRRLEHLHGSAGDDRALDAANELLALSAEHRADDDLQPGVGEGAYRRQLTARSGLRRRGRLLRLLRPVPLVAPAAPTLAIWDGLRARE